MSGSAVAKRYILRSDMVVVMVFLCLFAASGRQDNCQIFRQVLVESKSCAKQHDRAIQCLSPEDLSILTGNQDSPARGLELYSDKTVNKATQLQSDIDVGVKSPENPVAQAEAVQSLGSSNVQQAARRESALAVLQDSVIFIYQSPTSLAQAKPSATGFLVALKSKTRPGAFLQLLVTARHVVDPDFPNCTGDLRPQLYVRLNKPNYNPGSKESGVAFEPLRLFVEGKKQYFVHPDDSIDLAIILLTPQNSPNFTSYGIRSLPITAFETPSETQQLRVGCPIMSVGLVPGFTGERRNHPILKPGVIASIPNESFAIGTDCNGKTRTMTPWLVASHMNEGSSGAPIYDWSRTVPFLIGIQSFALYGQEPAKPGSDDLERVDYDVAGITPVAYLYEAIQHMNITEADISLRHP